MDGLIDDRTLARATLAACVDGPDPVMHALIAQARHTQDAPGGSDGDAAPAVLNLLERLLDGGHDGDLAGKELDALFARASHDLNATRAPSFEWFHQWRSGWCQRLAAFHGRPRGEVEEALTDGGRQWILAPGDVGWPSRLDDLALRAGSAPPLCLWGMGERHVFATCAEPVAVVGSRNVDGYGWSCAHGLGDAMAAAGHLVVSGGAMGTDAAAHWGAVDRMRRDGVDAAGGGVGRTVAVLAGGVDHAGPAGNHRLFDLMLANGGALVSERAPGTVPLAHRFLERNRIIAALSHTIVVAQARLRSGALNTALCGLEMFRDVYAVPGPIDSPANAGCNWAVYQQKASLLPSVAELAGLVHMAHRAEVPAVQAVRIHVGEDAGENGDGGEKDSPDRDGNGTATGADAMTHQLELDLRASAEPPERNDADEDEANETDADVAFPTSDSPSKPAMPDEPVTPSEPAKPDARRVAVLTAIRGCSRSAGSPATIDAIAERTGISPADVMATLGAMELEGLVTIDAQGAIRPAGPRTTRPSKAHHMTERPTPPTTNIRRKGGEDMTR